MSAPVAVHGGATVRERWRMEPEARGLILVSALLLVFGLVVLYSASAITAMNSQLDSSYYLTRQLVGAGVGVAAFMIAAKIDADRWKDWAWPFMWFTIVTMTLVLLLPESIAPRVNGSKRFLFGTSFQPSEWGKLAVVVWVSMLIVKKGDQLRRFTKGLLPFLLVIALLGALAALEPDLSVTMLYTLLMGVLLFAGGARMGHFVMLGALSFPLLWPAIERLQYVLLRLTSFFDPGAAPAEVSYQLRQSLLAVGSGRIFGTGFGEGRQQYGFLPYPYSDFIGSNIGEEWGFIGLAAVVVAFGIYGLFGFRIARRARSPFLQLVALGLTFTTVLTA
jgi:cell division protein FtsW